MYIPVKGLFTTVSQHESGMLNPVVSVRLVIHLDRFSCDNKIIGT